jgi:hypothetical protein
MMFCYLLFEGHHRVQPSVRCVAGHGGSLEGKWFIIIAPINKSYGVFGKEKKIMATKAVYI